MADIVGTMKHRYFLLLSLLVFGAAIPAFADNFNLDSLFAASVGGPEGVEVLRRAKSMTVEGTISLNGQTGRFVEYVRPPMSVYQRLEFGTVSMVQAYDGRVAWQQDFNGKVSILDGFERQTMVSAAYFETVSYLFDDRVPGQAMYVGDTTIDDTLFHRVTFIPNGEDTVTAFFEAATGHMLMLYDQVDQFFMVTRYEDFRDTLGLNWSMHSKAKALNAPLRVETDFTRLAFNEDVSSVSFSPPTEIPQDFRFPADASQVTIPFVYNVGHITLTATINGERKALFILDSGASMNLYDKAALAGLHIEEVGAIPAQGVSGFDQVSLVQTDSVQIGELTLLGQVGGVIDLGWLAAMQDTSYVFGGLLGYDFLSRFPVMIDYKKNELTVFNPESFEAPAGGIEVPFSLTMQVPTVEATVAGVSGDFIVDLGNAMSLILHKPFFDSNGMDTLLADVGRNKVQTGGVGGAGMGITATVPELSFGSVTIDNVEAVVPETEAGFGGSREVAGNIGNELLSRYTVLFDYANDRMILYPKESEQD